MNFQINLLWLSLGILDATDRWHYPTTSKAKNMDKELLDAKIDKRFFSVVSLSDQSNDKDYWFDRDPIERMRHIEVLRRINYGHCATSGLQRVLEFTEE